MTDEPKNTPEDACIGCRFFERVTGFGADAYGNCRRHAPSPNLRVHWYAPDAPPSTSDDARRAVWPIVQGGEWCGEFTAR